MFQAVNHGVDTNMMADMTRLAREFFSLTTEEKLRFDMSGGKSGFGVSSHLQSVVTSRIARGGNPQEVQSLLLEYGVEIFAETLVEGLSRIKRCTDEGRALMSLDIQAWVIKNLGKGGHLKKSCSLTVIAKLFADHNGVKVTKDKSNGGKAYAQVFIHNLLRKWHIQT